MSAEQQSAAGIVIYENAVQDSFSGGRIDTPIGSSKTYSGTFCS